MKTLVFIVGFILLGGILLTLDYGSGDRPKSALDKQLEAKFAACKKIVNGMDGGRFTVKENGYFYGKCLEVGPQGFVDRVKLGIFTLRDANR